MLLNKLNQILECDIKNLMKRQIFDVLILAVDDMYQILNNEEFKLRFFQYVPTNIKKIVIQYPGRTFDRKRIRLDSLNKIKNVKAYLSKIDIPIFYSSLYDTEAKFIQNEVQLANLPIFELYHSFIRYKEFYEYKSDECLYDISFGTSYIKNINKLEFLLPVLKQMLVNKPEFKIVFSQKIKNEILPEMVKYVDDDRIQWLKCDQKEYVSNIISKSKVLMTGSISETGPRMFLFGMMFGKISYFPERFKKDNGELLIDEFKPYQRFYNEQTSDIDFIQLDDISYEKIIEIIKRYV